MDERPYQLHIGEALSVLRTLPDCSVNCCVCSPPYFALRSYLDAGHPDKAQEIGTEDTPAAYVAHLAAVFAEVRRVLTVDGLLFLNLGDSYASGEIGRHDSVQGREINGKPVTRKGTKREQKRLTTGLPPKNLMMIPARVAIALQDNGWIIRSEIIWAKGNPMPESVTDRPTKAHEMVYMLAKSNRYFFDAEAIAEDSIYPDDNRKARQKQETYDQMMSPTGQIRAVINPKGAKTYPTKNARTVWNINSKGTDFAHFATMPEELARRCIVAGCPPNGTVLDPFCGSGTTLAVAIRHGRRGLGIELSEEYGCLAHRRICAETLNLFAQNTEAEKG